MKSTKDKLILFILFCVCWMLSGRNDNNSEIFFCKLWPITFPEKKSLSDMRSLPPFLNFLSESFTFFYLSDFFSQNIISSHLQNIDDNQMEEFRINLILLVKMTLLFKGISFQNLYLHIEFVFTTKKIEPFWSLLKVFFLFLKLSSLGKFAQPGPVFQQVLL